MVTIYRINNWDKPNMDEKNQQTSVQQFPNLVAAVHFLMYY